MIFSFLVWRRSDGDCRVRIRRRSRWWQASVNTNGATDNHFFVEIYWSLYNVVLDSIQCYVAHFTTCTFPLCKQPNEWNDFFLFSLTEKRRRLSRSDQTKVKMVAGFTKHSHERDLELHNDVQNADPFGGLGGGGPSTSRCAHYVKSTLYSNLSLSDN